MYVSQTLKLYTLNLYKLCVNYTSKQLEEKRAQLLIYV